MENLSDYIYHHKTLLIILLIIFLGVIGSVFAWKYDDNLEETEVISDANQTIENEIIPEEKEIEEKVEQNQTIDIKGAIKNPGVYKIAPNTRIYEIIEMAGGITANGTTENINLSKKVVDEMVIYIFSKEELNQKNNCNIKNEYSGEISKEIQEKESMIYEKDPEKNNLQAKVSLNKATLEELISIDGIGTAKAENIIKYRIEHQGFQTIEELKEVSGIGENLFIKIKDYFILE